jgi:hypothetical protein
VADGVWIGQSEWFWNNFIAVRGERGLSLVDLHRCFRSEPASCRIRQTTTGFALLAIVGTLSGCGVTSDRSQPAGKALFAHCRDESPHGAREATCSTFTRTAL